jgi:sugar (pentulose or hexulose) kinase
MTSEADVVVGLDVGTTAVKAVAVDLHGQTIATAASAEISTSTDPPGSSEQDPEEIWRAVVAATRGVLEKTGHPARVKGLSMATQSGSVIALAADGSPVSRAITWMDSRSRPVVESWSEATHRLIREVTGWQSSAGLGLATISWLRASGAVPDSARFSSVDDYLVGLMTGTPLTNPSNAAGMQLMDVATLRWSDRLCALAGVNTSELSPIHRSGTAAGGLAQAAGAELGLESGTQIVVGGHDQACAALGLVATEPGAIVLSAGTAWVITAATDAPAVEQLPDSLNLSPHVIDQRWSVSENLGGLGAVLGWILEESSVPVAELDPALHPWASADHAPFFLPNLQSEDRRAWGRFVGEVDVVEGTARVLAAFEACAFEVRRAAEQAGAFTEPDATFTVVGGGTRAPALMQMIAVALDRSLIVKPDASWPALGAARLAGGACGWAMDSPDGPKGVQVTPEVGMLTKVDQRYRQYLDLRGETSP